MKFITLTTLSLVSFLLTFNLPSANAATNDEAFTVYLVRHAEKVLDQKNPPLTSCGVKRAEQLAVMLEQADLKSIYSTQYTRTEQTAAPLAKKLGFTVKPYSPRDLATFSQQIKQQKSNVLIVGHSNTSPQLTALIANTQVENITEKEYQMLYQVHFSSGKAHLTVLKQPWTCQ